MSIGCDACTSIISGVINNLGSDLTCDEVGEEFVAAVEVAGGGPEDPVADAVAIGGAAAISSLCSEYGWSWIKSNVDQATQQLCQKLDLC